MLLSNDVSFDDFVKSASLLADLLCINITELFMIYAGYDCLDLRKRTVADSCTDRWL